MACDRFTEEGLAVFPMTPERATHLASCESCRQTAQRYERLEKLLTVACGDAVPPAGWEDRLESAIKSWRPRPVWPRRLALVGAAVATAAAAGVGLVVVKARVGEEASSVQAIVELPTGVRSTAAAVGGRYRIEARAWKEARIWLNGHTLVGRCPGGSGCEAEGSALRLVVPLSVAGEYRVMVLRAGAGEVLDAPVSLDEDVQRVRLRHGQYEVLEPLSVY